MRYCENFTRLAKEAEAENRVHPYFYSRKWQKRFLARCENRLDSRPNQR